jgi:hypothetical protein
VLVRVSEHSHRIDVKIAPPTSLMKIRRFIFGSGG